MDMRTYLFLVEAKNKKAKEGGPGSGNFGHAGVPGQLGGSSSEPGGGDEPRTTDRQTFGTRDEAKSYADSKMNNPPSGYAHTGDTLTRSIGTRSVTIKPSIEKDYAANPKNTTVRWTATERDSSTRDSHEQSLPNFGMAIAASNSFLTSDLTSPGAMANSRGDAYDWAKGGS